MNQTYSTAGAKRHASVNLGRVRIESVPELIATGIVLAASAVSPLMFVGPAAGYASMNFYAKFALIPAIVAVIAVTIVAKSFHWRRLTDGIAIAVVSGIFATVALEAARVVGFRMFHAMPGSMPMLMGVLITDRSLLGPNIWSNLIGWGDHVINGISFALVYVLIFGRPRWWKAIPYAWLIATIFMISPDMTMLGDIGAFGHAMGPGFSITVYVAHTLFGLTLGTIVARWAKIRAPIWRRHVGARGGGASRS